MIKKIGLKTAATASVIIAVVTILIHLLVILQIIPYTWINGGRSASFEAASQASWVSIIILVIFIFIYLWAGRIIPITRFKRLFTVILWLMFAYACLGIIMQFLGTPFEKAVTGVLCILNAIATFRLAIKKR